MFSYLLHISLFIDILLAGVLTFGFYKFIHYYNLRKDKKYVFLGSIFFTYLLTIIASFVSKLSFILNLGIDYAIEIEKIGLYGVILNSVAAWLFYINARKRKAVISSAIVFSVGAILLLYILLSPIQIIYKDNTINPILENAYVIPVKIYWLILWLNLGLLYAFGQIAIEKEELKKISRFLAIAIFIILSSNVSAYLYTYKAQIWYLLAAWILNFIGWINFFLGEAIIEEKIILKNPWHYFRTKFIYKLVSIFVILIFISVEGVALLTLHLSKSSIIKAKIDSFQENSYSLDSKIDNYLYQKLKKLSNLTPAISLDNPDLNKKVIKNFLIGNPVFNHVAIYSMRREKIIHENTPLYKEYNNEGKYLKDIQEKIKSGKEYLNLVYDGIDSVFILGVGLSENRALRGFICASLNLDDLFNMVRSIRIGKFGYLFVMTKDGMLLHPDPKRVEIKERYLGQKFFENVFKKEKYGGVLKDEIGRQILGASIINKKYGWVVISEQPLEESYEAMKKAEANSVLFVVIASILTLIVGISLARSIEKPVKEMIQGTNIISKGNLTHQIKIKNIDELGHLAEAFNKMTRDLDEAQKKLVDAEKIKLVSQMSISLNHEINNPMQSILFIAQTQSHMLKKMEQKSEKEKAEEIEKIVKRMGEFSSILESQTKKIKDIIYSLRQLREVETVEYLPGAPMLKLAKHTGFAPKDLAGKEDSKSSSEAKPEKQEPPVS